MLRVWLLALVGLMASLLVPVGSGTAAVTSYLCWGYDGCQKAGYSHANYKQNASKMWWRMYSGHNCTNYVAYRLIQNGYSSERPWTGSGNATNWGVAMKSITDTTPTVGSVAWWKAGQGGVGSAGHVAYVEKVVSSTEIIVSQDSWGGDFSWRRITKSSSSWPSGFIHFNDRTITSTAAPTIQGTAKVGATVKTAGAKWDGKPTTIGRQWYADGVAIPGANKASFTVAPAQVGKKLTATITASRDGFTPATASAPATKAVEKGEFAPIDEPVLNGAPELDETLELTTNAWTPSPNKVNVKWFADGKRITDPTGANVTGTKLTLTEAQVDARIHVRVVVNGPGYVKAAKDTAATEPVVAGATELSAPTKVTGKPRVGDTLTATPGKVSPTDATTTITWLRDGKQVGTGPTYVVQGADLGRVLRVQTTATLKSHRPATSLTDVAKAAFTKPVLTAEPVGKKGAAVVHVKGSAPGVSGLSGTVMVKVGKQKVRAELVNGKAKVRVEGLKKGRARSRRGSSRPFRSRAPRQ